MGTTLHPSLHHTRPLCTATFLVRDRVLRIRPLAATWPYEGAACCFAHWINQMLHTCLTKLPGTSWCQGAQPHTHLP